MNRFARYAGLFSVFAVLCSAGCYDGALSDAEKWWLAPPQTAERIAFEKNGKWGYKDRAGVVVISPRFDYAASFPGEGNVLVQGQEKAVHVRVPSRPMGRVRLGGKWGYIDGQGKILIVPQYEKALDFFEDLTAVRIDGKWGFIDAAGKMILPPQYDEASPFLLGVAHVRQGARWYTINRAGKNTAENAP